MKISAIFILAFFPHAILTLGVAADDSPKHLLGKIDFPNSGAPEAQADFTEGVLYMHNFEYAEAGAAFKRAQAIDPNFALAYWGEAMTFHQSLWGRQSTSSARDVLSRLGKTSESRAAKAPTPREKDYIAAVEILFGMTEQSRELPKHDRDVQYRDFMRQMHEKYPDDHEALAFYGLSILGAGSENRDYATYMKAAAVLTEVWDANRMHPGAAHYLIHAYDDPVHAPLGLPMARAYSKIAPDAAHAQHMTSHIFVAMGMWDDLVASNEQAVEVESQSASETGGSMENAHYLYWLQYGYLQQGRYNDARKLLEQARAKLDANPAERDKLYFGAMYARYALEADKAAPELRAPEDIVIPSAHYHFALAYQAIAAKDLKTAQRHRENMNALKEGNPEVALSEAVVAVLRKELDVLTALAQSDAAKAIALAKEAAADAEKLPIRYGPPQVTMPAHELLGMILLDEGKAAEAVPVLEKQLETTPRRAAALFALAIAAKKAGNAPKADEALSQLAAIWQSGDSEVALALVVAARQSQ